MRNGVDRLAAERAVAGTLAKISFLSTLGQAVSVYKAEAINAPSRIPPKLNVCRGAAALSESASRTPRPLFFSVSCHSCLTLKVKAAARQP